ncbi:hypothetical protein [Larkinella rosea]|nr:hypothetical protein [Larkinella rosea]
MLPFVGYPRNPTENDIRQPDSGTSTDGQKPGQSSEHSFCGSVRQAQRF